LSVTGERSVGSLYAMDHPVGSCHHPPVGEAARGRAGRP